MADLLAQRFKSVKHGAITGTFNDCLELIPQQHVGITTVDEQGLAARDLLLRNKLAEVRDKQKKS